MKNIKLIFLFLSFLGINTTTNAQTASPSISVLNHQSYIENPEKYLSKLNIANIKSKILLDKYISDDINILNCNGKDKVTNLEDYDWKSIYNTLYLQTMIP